MPKKPIKWDLKVWCAANASSKYIYDLDVYCKGNLQTLEDVRLVTAKRNLGHKVLTRLTTRLEHKGQVVMVDNFFTSVTIF